MSLSLPLFVSSPSHSDCLSPPLSITLHINHMRIIISFFPKTNVNNKQEQQQHQQRNNSNSTAGPRSRQEKDNNKNNMKKEQQQLLVPLSSGAESRRSSATTHICRGMHEREWESARHIAHLHDDVDAINLPDCGCDCVVPDSVAFCASAAVDNVVVVVVAVAARCAR